MAGFRTRQQVAAERPGFPGLLLFLASSCRRLRQPAALHFALLFRSFVQPVRRILRCRPSSCQKTCRRRLSGRRWGLLNLVLREAMKRLLVCLLMVGIAGCGGDSSPSSKNNGSPAQAPDTDPVAALEKLLPLRGSRSARSASDGRKDRYTSGTWRNLYCRSQRMPARPL